ncbi:MAG: hypothetical protein GXP37_08685, partial [Chloroflexi bacterium]|nr:hypothetical protein [Chloroflexota bacterium]
MNANTKISRRRCVQNALVGAAPRRLLIGELEIVPDVVRQIVGLEADATVPLEAEKAVLTRWQHDLVTVPFSHGWGALQQPDETDAMIRLNYWQKHSDLFVFALMDGPFSTALKAWSWQDALIRIGRSDPEVEAFMADAVMDISTQLQKIAAAGADGILLGEDIAIRRGPLVRPSTLQKVYFPFLTLLVMNAHDLGLYVVFHSDGNLWMLWDQLLASGIDGIQCLDPYSAMSMALGRERSPREFCLWGNLDLGWLAQHRDDATVRAHLHEMLSPLRGTPTIFGSSSGLFPGIPLAQLDLLYGVARELSWQP